MLFYDTEDMTIVNISKASKLEFVLAFQITYSRNLLLIATLR